MANISIDDVQRLARLSGLELSETEADDMVVDLENILSYVSQLDELDTSGVEPTYQVTGLENVWRQDEVEASEVSREDLLALAAQSRDSQVKVPKVL